MNLYKKKYKDKKEADFYFDKYNVIYNNSLNQSYYKITKPIKVDNNIIYFKKINGILLGLNNSYYLGKYDLLYKMGFALGKLHLDLNNNLIGTEETYNIHGDFCPGNFLIDEYNNIWFIDFEPPNWELEKDRTKGIIYEDLGKFIFQIKTMYPVWMFYRTFFRSKEKEIKTFLLGYEKATSLKLDSIKLNNKFIEFVNTEKQFIIKIDVIKNKKIYRLVRYFYLLFL